jgi:hypothetical protein
MNETQTSEALATTTTTEVPQHAPEGFENLLDTDLVLPRLAIVQPTSKVGTAGMVRCALTGLERAELTMVPVRIQRGRVLWGETLGEDPLCRSNDGYYPAPNVEKPVHETCCVLAGRRLRPVCPMAIWGHAGNGNGRGERPRCRDTFAIAAVDLAGEMPFLFAVHGAAIRSLRAFLTTVFRLKLNLFDVSCTLRLEKVNGSKGVSYIPRFDEVTPVQPLGKYRRQYEALARYALDATFEAEGDGNGAAADHQPA